MSRPMRTDPAGGWHHVMNRGSRKYHVFLDDADRLSFLALVADACERHGAEVVAYCLMGNHFHLVLHCPTGDLSGTMQFLTSMYVRSFNLAHGFDGALFRDRFTSVSIESDEALLQTTRYVHRNPLELGINIDRYRWSSHSAYLGFVPSPRWLASSVPVLAAGGRNNYRSFVETDMASDKTSFARGVGEFVAQPRPSRMQTFLDPIDETVARLFEVSRGDLLRPSRGRRNVARMAAILIAVDRGADTRDVATRYNLASNSAARSVASRARRLAESDPAFGSAVRLAVQELTARTGHELAS